MLSVWIIGPGRADGSLAAAPVLRRAVCAGAELLTALEYAVVVDPPTLRPLVALLSGDEQRLPAACRSGGARRIDNVGSVSR